MASIGGLSGSSGSSSIYGTRNVLSGLASGLDTESMIENAVSGYQMKLSSLQQQKTKVEWKQEAYRSMITKMVGFSQKYTSYTSGTNLLSSSFFDNATKVTSLGANASKISATGRTSSNVQINSVTQLAEAAKYTVESAAFSGNNIASNVVSLTGAVNVGLLDGNMTFSYGNKNIAISFGEKDGYASAKEMAAAINKKLEEEIIAFDSGSQEKASERIKAVVSEDGKSISIEKVKSEDGNTLKISSVSGNLDEALGVGKIDKEATVTSFEFDAEKVSKTRSVLNVLRDEGFTIKYNGETFKIDGPSTSEVNAIEGDDRTFAEKYIAALQGKIDEAMGAGKITVSNAFTGADSSGKKVQFQFTPANTSDEFEVTSPLAEKLGMEGGLSNKVNLSRKLGDVIAGGLWKNGQEKKDSDGNVIKGSDGKPIIEYEFKLNDSSSIKVTKDMTLQQLMDEMNSNEASAVKMNYSAFTGKVTLSTKETGANQEIKLSGLSRALFVGDDVEDAVVLDQGKNAEFYVSVNGEPAQRIERSSNTIDIDGMQVTLKGTFGKAPNGEGDGAVQQSEGTASDEPVTFSFSSDSDKIVDAIKEMVKDYNAMMSEVKEAYSTIPLKNSKGQDYMPLTDEDAADMSESAIANYEKKAKTGLLFADRDLSSFYSGMTEVLRAFGVTGNDGNGIGITTSYSNGTTTLVVDESALRAALDSNPDKVRDVFVGKNGNDGVMAKMKNQLDTYAGTTGASKGILINKAGSTLAPTSIYQNTLQKEIDAFEDDIESWQDKIADKIDYYNKKFTTLEKLIAQMNNQSSMLGGLSGGY
ncbi:MAG: flagellar filament capping protein FliD [Oscillospiraceae bacterium]|nr:flagellar filament capping protein FliD [Oscillospiraceae bacterium]